MTHFSFHRRYRLCVCLLSLVTLIASGCDRKEQSKRQTREAGSEKPREVVALGRLEPAGGIISVSAIPGEQILRYSDGVKEGKTVEPGSRLADLSSDSLGEKQLAALKKKKKVTSKKHDYEKSAALLQVQQAEASKAEAQAKLDEVAAQKLKLPGLQVASSLAAKDVERLRQLQEQDSELVTKYEIDRKENEADRAQADYSALVLSLQAAEKAAQAAFDAAEESLKIANSNIEKLDDMDPAEVVQHEIDITKETLRKSELRAPGKAGGPPLTVLKTLVEPGEFITQLPVMQVADLSQMICIAEVYEGDRTQIKEDQRVVIKSASFDKKFQEGIPGKVVQIGSMIGNPELTNRNPLAPSDRSVFEVRIALDPLIDDEAKKKKMLEEATAEAAARIGLQVTVEFQAPEQEQGSKKAATKEKKGAKDNQTSDFSKGKEKAENDAAS